MDFSIIAEEIREFWPHLIAAITLFTTVIASAHAVMYKRDSRSAAGWVGIIWLVPILGAVLYVLLAINRIRRRAVNLRGSAKRGPKAAAAMTCSPAALIEALGPGAAHLASLGRLVGELTSRPLLQGNRVEALGNGDEAYPEMIRAIDEAQRSVGLSTYIFNNDRAGQMFTQSLANAVGRGVEVRVLVDDIGARYTWPSIERSLRAAGVPLARFLPTFIPTWSAYANLRNHRKLLIADGRIGFTGGLNIREGHCHQFKPVHFIQDLHFRLEGPVVAHLQEVFANDWAYCTNELLDSEKWFPALGEAGDAIARGISAGPDGDYDKLHLTLLGAVACAESSIAIVTPYFLPDAALVTALNVASLRGIEVDIIVPENNNLSLVQWASTALFWQLLEHGCRIWLTPGPFDHTKVMLVDRAWSFFGSGNWDPRSLRLNFEFDVECYNLELAGKLQQTVAQKLQQAHRVTLDEVDRRAIPVRLRDGVARLLTPYL